MKKKKTQIAPNRVGKLIRSEAQPIRLKLQLPALKVDARHQKSKTF